MAMWPVKSQGDLINQVLQKIEQRVSEVDSSPPPECSICNDLGVITIDRSVAPCVCHLRGAAENWVKYHVPTPFRSVLMGRWLGRSRHPFKYILGYLKDQKFDLIEPSEVPERRGFKMEGQRYLLEHLRENPYMAYGFFGETGWGKSLLIYALAKEAMFALRRIIGFGVSNIGRLLAPNGFDDLLLAVDSREFKSGPAHIYIDEIEKVLPPAEARSVMFRLADMAYTNQDSIRLSWTSNLTAHEFSQEYGAATARRLIESTNPIEMEEFNR